jgi:hypothetical protein
VSVRGWGWGGEGEGVRGEGEGEGVRVRGWGGEGWGWGWGGGGEGVGVRGERGGVRVAVGAPTPILGVLSEGGVVSAARAAEVVGHRDQVVHRWQGGRCGAVAWRHDVGPEVEAHQREVDLVRVGVRLRLGVGVEVRVRVRKWEVDLVRVGVRLRLGVGVEVRVRARKWEVDRRVQLAPPRATRWEALEVHHEHRRRRPVREGKGCVRCVWGVCEVCVWGVCEVCVCEVCVRCVCVRCVCEVCVRCVCEVCAWWGLPEGENDN